MSIETLWQSGLQTTLAVSLLIMFVLLARRPVAKRFGAHAAYMLWTLPVIRLVLPPLPEGWSPLAALWPKASSAPAVVEAAANPMLIAAAAPSPAPNPILITPTGEALAPVPAAPTPVVDLAANASTINWPMLVLFVWLGGAVAFLAWAIYRQIEFTRVLSRECETPSASLVTRANRIASRLGLGRRVDVQTSLVSSGPMVTGAFRPLVLLPAWFEEDYSEDEQAVALMHEMTHIKRGDLFMLHFATLFLALQWFNPLAHFAMRAFRSDQEAACDADVLATGDSSPRTYGETLVKTVRFAHPRRASFAATPATGLTLDHAIKERLILMQNPAPSLKKRLLGASATAGIGAVALLLTAPVVAQELDGSDEAVKAHRVIIDNGNSNRQLVLLGDPFSTVELQLEALDDLDFDFDFDFEELGEMDFEMDFDFDFDFSDLAALSELAVLGDVDWEEMAGFEGFEIERIETEDGVKIVIPRQTLEFSPQLEALEELMEGLEIKIEAQAELMGELAERHSERIEEWAAMHEERAEAYAERAEAYAERYEERAEAWSDRIEEMFDDEFEGNIEAAAELVEDLSDDCDDFEFASNEPAVVLSATLGDATYKAVCVNGGASKASSTEVTDFVLNNADLSQAEKNAFVDRDDDNSRIEVKR